MPLIKPPKFWLNVPQGSHLEAHAEGSNENFTIDMTVDSSGDDDAVINQKRLEAGTNIPLENPNQYVMTVRMNFAGTPPPSVTFRARIIKADGTQYLGAYQFTVSDPGGSPYRALMIAVTAH